MGEDRKDRARSIFDAGVVAADPCRAVMRSLDAAPLPPCADRLYCIAVGKAAMGMADTVLARLKPDRTIVVTTPENADHLAGAEVFAAGHPVPDETGLEAAETVIELLQGTGPDDHVVVLISGGGSALLPAPVAGITLADKIRVNERLLASGLDITAMNLVRQQLSRLKGGGLARLACPARVTALILSDVVGDDLRAVASGPTLPRIGPRSQARATLWGARIWQAMPKSVRNILSEPDEGETNALPAGCEVENRLIGSNSQSLAAMAQAAPDAHVHDAPLVGDVAEAAQVIASAPDHGISLFGGETTVRLTGTGLGGRNQELALRVALLAEEQGWAPGWVFLSGGTDGRDGPTDAAGGLVDAGTLGRMRAAGVDPQAALANNDSYHALQAAGDLLITGATGTNVADLQVLIRP